MSMNLVAVTGRIVNDPDVHYTTGENSNANVRGTVAVQRSFKNKETGRYDADFIRFVAWGGNAEFINKYFKKGDPIELMGEWRTGDFTNKDGVKVYTNDLWVNRVGFAMTKKDGDGGASNSAAKPDDEFMRVPEDDGSELPFN